MVSKMILSKLAVEIAASATSDEEIVERVKAGETVLFEALMRRHNQRLYRVARSILGEDDEAEDVMQDAYVRSYIHLNQFDGRAKFVTWLTKIAVHEALARFRKRKKLVSLDTVSGSIKDNMNLEANTPSPEQVVLTNTLKIVLESAVDKLPETYRSVFMLREIEGMSTAEAAECLDLSLESVKVRLHRARSLLRKHIYTKTGAATSVAFQFLGAQCDSLVTAVLTKPEIMRLVHLEKCYIRM